MKCFNEWLQLHESMDVHVDGYNFHDDVHDISDLGYYLANKIIHPLWDKLTPEQQQAVRDGGSGQHQMITVDWSNENQLSFYAAGWPEPMVKTILQGIKYHLDNMQVKYGPFKRETSRAYGTEVYRIPILQFKPTQDAPPQLNLSNSNAILIFRDLLKYPTDSESGGFSDVNVRELLMKIEQLERDQIELHQRDPYSTSGKDQASMYHGGLMADDIEKRLAVIKRICQWAISHHYDKVYVA